MDGNCWCVCLLSFGVSTQSFLWLMCLWGFLENSFCLLESSVLRLYSSGGGSKEKKDGRRARTSRCLYRRAEKKEEKERERDPPSAISPSLLSLWRSCRWEEAGFLASAVLRSALCSSALELWDSLLPAARRFSCDPERGLPQRLTNFITTFSPTLLNHQLANPQPIQHHQ